MVIDLHVHTKPLSQDSLMDVEEATQEAKRIGLDGLCLTEHNKVWEAEAITRLREKWDFLLLRGVEVETPEGHVLVFGVYQGFEGIVHLDDLRKLVTREDGIMVAAHPFKGFVAFNSIKLGLSPEQAAKRPVFQNVDLIEGFNGRLNKDENDLAQAVGRRLGIKSTGGSDAHSIKQLGKCVTIFENKISSEAELLSELKMGRFQADYFTGKGAL